jgi:hypothetical protein
MERVNLIDNERLASNVATETYQPHHGSGGRIREQPLEQRGSVGIISTITRSDLGYGASYSFTEPIANRWHPVSGAEPLVSRAVGA